MTHNQLEKLSMRQYSENAINTIIQYLIYKKIEL